MKHIVSFSGGKDSTAMLLRMIEEGMTIDEIVYCEVMATKTLGGEYPEMYEYLDKVEEYIGRKITRIKTKISFEEQFYKVKQRGNRKGEIYGFPYTIGAWCNDRLKMVAIDKYFKEQGEHIRYIGIAYDEPERFARLEDNEKAPLYDWKMTEQDCIDYLKDKGLYNPLYDKFSRLGCWFCPKQSLKSLKILRQDYPELWQMLLNWQKDSKNSFLRHYTVQELEEKFKNDLKKNKK